MAVADNNINSSVEFTLLMPCLNEAETLEICIRKARGSLERLGLKGEVLVADNGSTDGSQAIAERCGARLVHVAERGYGSALMGGIEAARGKYVIMGDADDSYDWSSIDGFIEKLRDGNELVMGCRFPRGGGTILPGAMPGSHRLLGTPVLTTIARLFFGGRVTDINCGLRGFSKEAIRRLNLRATGMEFASEMIVKATMADLRIAETPIVLHPDGRSGPAHLRTFHDGWRHLRFMLLYSPTWLFLVPGFLGFLFGALGFLLILPGPLWVGRVGFDANTLLVCSLSMLVGSQCIIFGFFARVFAITERLIPENRALAKVFSLVTLETGLTVGVVVSGVGALLLLTDVVYWARHGFGEMPYPVGLRIVIPAVTLLALGIQIVFSSFFLSMLGLERK